MTKELYTCVSKWYTGSSFTDYEKYNLGLIIIISYSIRKHKQTDEKQYNKSWL